MNPSPLIWCVGGEDVHRRIPLLKQLQSAGYRIGAVGSQHSAPFDAEGIAYRRYSLDRNLAPFADLASMRELTEHFKDGAPDIIHAFDTKPSIYAIKAAARAGVPRRVRTITGLGYMFSDDSLKAMLMRQVYGAMQKSVRQSASWTVFQNPDDQRYFIDGNFVDASRTSLVLGSGISISAIDDELAKGPSRKEIRASLGLDGCKVALLPTRLIRSKGVMEYVGLARSLYERNKPFRFLIAGPLEPLGPQAVSEQEIASGGEAVRYIGNRADIISVMAACDAVVLPSYYREGVPRSLLEAAAIGLPLVTTDVPGCREAVVDGKTGWIVPARDAQALESAVKKAFALGADGRKKMKDAARSHIRDLFELQHVARSYSDIYKNSPALC
jgi:glycosyltransferase involved in cell wall biosynthesis